MLCIVCQQAQSEATRVKVHTTHSGTRYSSPCLVLNLWVSCHIRCVNCPNKRHRKCEICGLYLNQTFEKIRWENYGLLSGLSKHFVITFGTLLCIRVYNKTVIVMGIRKHQVVMNLILVSLQSAPVFGNNSKQSLLSSNKNSNKERSKCRPNDPPRLLETYKNKIHMRYGVRRRTPQSICTWGEYGYLSIMELGTDEQVAQRGDSLY
ncbi:hypothetical protein TSAR_005803 [Trichomalopsis sarcophagae]|uniref:Uncharacterized protein n=1 Tax=Trichomalopsis sarcophagae TaxID=543379 RepID=A0A232EGV1_9HYME|nr:hypothetical protein TSAR_005803 [Trichomalopsis sarcophagae]